VTTHEREITEPVELCSDDHRRLNPEAIGFSRTPLHVCNLGPATGNTKRWDYWAILAGDLAVSTVYSDIDVIGLADVYWVDLTTGESGGHAIITDADGSITLPDVPSTSPLAVRVEEFDLRIVDERDATVITATWRENGLDASLAARVERPEGHESVNVVVPWSDELFNFTSKHQARPASGRLMVGDREWVFGGNDGDAWGVLDIGRGRWPHEITWNWGGGAGRAGEHVVGLQFGAKWTAGTGATENGVIVDGRLSKIGRELEWHYDWDRPMEPWRIIDPEGQLDVTLTPRFDKVTDVEASAELSSRVHQVFGTWRGHVVTDEGDRIEFDGLLGFAEEARQRW
jgi:hypothetical protein